MRTTRTFILRLLVDSEEPARIRGALRPVAHDEELAFSEEQSLLSLIREAGLSPERITELSDVSEADDCRRSGKETS